MANKPMRTIYFIVSWAGSEPNHSIIIICGCHTTSAKPIPESDFCSRSIENQVDIIHLSFFNAVQCTTNTDVAFVALTHMFSLCQAFSWDP